MDRDPHPVDPHGLPQTYKTLVNLWTSGVRDYHSLLSDYLTANSIFVAAIGFILARQPTTFLFTFLGMILCVFGILMVVQMAIVLGRFSAQIALWEWQLRGSELQTSWTQPQLFIRLQQYRDHHQSLEDRQNDPPVFAPDLGTPPTLAMVGPSRVQLSHIFRDCVYPFPGVECDAAFRVNFRDTANDHDIVIRQYEGH